MVVDTSALIAIVRNEPEAEAFTAAVARDRLRYVGAPTWLEFVLVLTRLVPARAVPEARALTEELGLRIVAFGPEQALIASEAFQRFGKGRHEAALNYGDCMSYALSAATGEPLLFKGTDFAATDIAVARW
jgi:ribonuclease VapC